MSRKRKKQAKEPDFLKGLSRPPETPWPHGALYHGTRIALLVLLAVAVTLLFPSQDRGTAVVQQDYQEGDVAREDVVAEVGFDVPKDSAELARQRADAAAAVPPVFLYQPETQEEVESDLNAFFDRIEEAVESGGQPAVEAVLEEMLPSLVAYSETLLDPMERRNLRREVLSVVQQLSDRVLDSDHEEAVLSAGQIQVIYPNGSERPLDAEELLWGTEFYREGVQTLGPSTSELRDMVRILLFHFFDSPYSLDEIRTTVKRSDARRAVNATEGRVVDGEIIVRRGVQIGPAELRRLQAHQNALQDQGLTEEPGRDWGSLFGAFLLNLILLGLFGFLLFFYRQEVYRSFRWVLLLAFLIFAYFLAAAGISWQAYPWELLPIAFVILPVAILWDGRMALILAMVMGVLTGAQEPFNDFPILAYTIIGGAAAALSARAVRRRSQTWIFIALITLGYALTLAAFGLLGAQEPGGVLVSVLFAAMNATISAILAMGFMPVFEWFTGITTDQTLLEWADPNRPLLKSLSLEASGTYAHTINVANLAEAAATAIGANGLLARVGIYYHDVGKMLKPQYFVENQPGTRNPHDKLKPHTSAAIVREHVLEGERIAREEGVPDVVARFIPEHHGTQLIGFFYEKAKEESEEEPNPDEFRYPGPKPRSKETAIAMLADSVESATRALQDSTPERVRNLVKTIVDGKIRDGQLSESPLTLKEISVIQEQFVKVVGGMFHHRLDYPATRHLTEAHREEGEKEENGQEADEGEGSSAKTAVEPRKAAAAPGAEGEQLPLTSEEEPTAAASEAQTVSPPEGEDSLAPEEEESSAPRTDPSPTPPGKSSPAPKKDDG